MKKYIVAGVTIVLLLTLIVTFAYFFSNDTSKIENIFNQTVKSLDNSCEGLKDMFTEDAKKYSNDLDGNINELKEFYQGKSTKVEDLVIYHETDNLFRAHAIITTDKDKYFLTISASGARYVDPKQIKQLVIAKYDEFDYQYVIKKKHLMSYHKQARVIGVTVRQPDDKERYNDENELLEARIKAKERIEKVDK